MSDVDADRCAALATRLGIAPSHLLVLAARVAETPDSAFDAARLELELDRLRNAGDAVDSAAALILLGYGGFGFDDLDHALPLIWSDVQVQGI
ncbi:MAG: hypothetical protein ABIS07_03085 [Dokdonella sp.]